MKTFTRTVALTAFAAGIAGIVGASPASAADAVELKLASFTGPKHAMNRAFFTPWAKKVDEESKGTLKIKMFVGGKLGNGGPRQFKRAVDGVADITFGLQGFTSSQFRRTTLIELPGIANDGVQATRALWNAYEGHLEKEYGEVKLLFMWTVDSPVIMTKNKPITKIEDLKGLKIRTPSQFQAKLLQSLGASPIPMPITKVYNALSRGLLDGVLTSTTTLTGFKLKEVTKYFADGLPWGRSPMFLVMNKNSYAGLSAAHKAVIDRTTGPKNSEMGSAVYDKESLDGFQLIKDSPNHELHRFSDEEIKKGTALLMKAGEEIIAEVEAQGIDAKAIVMKMKAAK
jgi:TRAP-type C4-dicarboxylate transport system substrate-binding protein